MPWLRLLIAKFCRWRANRALAKAGRAIDLGHAWLKRERSIINPERANGTKEAH